MTLHRLHNTLFWILLVCFIVTTGTILFFTFGYRFSFERGIFVYTGSITIKSNPRDVDIIVDGEPFPENRISTVNRTLHLTGLRPGSHMLRVEAPGFRPWEKQVTIRSGVSTEFWNIVLPRDTHERTDLLEGGLLEVFFSPRERRFAVVAEEEGLTRILVLDRSSGESEEIFSTDAFVFEEEAPENIEWSPDGDQLLVPLRSRDGTRTIFTINLRTLEPIDWGAESGFAGLHSARWDPMDNRAFFALSDGKLLRITPEETEMAQRIQKLRERVMTYDLSGRTIYLLESGSDTLLSAPLGRQTLETEPLLPSIPRAGTFTSPKISVYDEKRIAVYNQDGSGYLINDDDGLEPELHSLGSGLRGVQFSDDGKKLLFYTTNEISVIFTRDWDMQPARESGEVIQIARFSSPIFQPKWSRDYEHVLFAEDGDIRMAELDRRDRRNIVTIDSQGADRQITQLLPDFGEGRIYTLVRDGQDRSTLSFIEFPEPIGFFGQ